MKTGQDREGRLMGEIIKKTPQGVFLICLKNREKLVRQRVL